MSAKYLAFILIALFFGLIVRLYGVNHPLADWHSHRQADTISVTKIFSTNGLDLLHPRYHDLSDVQSGLENPNGYRMVEFPFYNLFSLGLFNLNIFNLLVSSRLISILMSLGSAILIYLICFQLTRTFAPSFAAMLVFLFLPFNIYYSRTTLPEPTAVFFMLLSLYFFSKNIFLSALSLAVSILIKPYTVLILFPALLLKTYQGFKKSTSRFKFCVLNFVFLVISLLPFILWRFWIRQFPEGIPRSDWLLNNGQTTTFPAWFHGYNLAFLNKLIAFRPHWFKWLFYERIGNLILGGFGLIPLFLGLLFRKAHTQKFTFSFILGILLYFIIIAQGNIQHDYYQTLIIPFLSVFFGFGLYYLFNFTYKSKIASIIAIIVIVFFSFYFSADQVKSYYQINRPQIIDAGAKARELLPQNSLVIAPYQGDTAFLYQTGFSGWPTEVYDFDNIIKLHPNRPIYLISVNFDDYTNSLIGKYPTIYRSPEFIILKITP